MEEIYPGVLRAIASLLPIRKIYIELGIADCHTFNQIAPLFDRAIAVDISQDAGGFITARNATFYCETTDEFFDHFKEQADFIFIDADHRSAYSWRDFNNATKIIAPLTGLLCLHDTYPEDATMIEGGCWDSYKTAIAIHRDVTEFESVTIPGGHGLTICRYVPPGEHLHWMT